MSGILPCSADRASVETQWRQRIQLCLTAIVTFGAEIQQRGRVQNLSEHYRVPRAFSASFPSEAGHGFAPAGLQHDLDRSRNPQSRRPGYLALETGKDEQGTP